MKGTAGVPINPGFADLPGSLMQRLTKHDDPMITSP